MGNEDVVALKRFSLKEFSAGLLIYTFIGGGFYFSTIAAIEAGVKVDEIQTSQINSLKDIHSTDQKETITAINKLATIVSAQAENMKHLTKAIDQQNELIMNYIIGRKELN